MKQERNEKNTNLTFKINHLIWTLFLVKPNDIKLQNDVESNEQNAGMTYFHDLEIYVDSTLPIALLKATITHEVAHAYLFSYGFGFRGMEHEEVCEFIGQNMQCLFEIMSQITNQLHQ